MYNKKMNVLLSAMTLIVVFMMEYMSLSKTIHDYSSFNLIVLIANSLFLICSIVCLISNIRVPIENAETEPPKDISRIEKILFVVAFVCILVGIAGMILSLCGVQQIGGIINGCGIGIALISVGISSMFAKR